MALKGQDVTRPSWWDECGSGDVISEVKRGITVREAEYGVGSFVFDDSGNVGCDGVCNTVRCKVVDLSLLLIFTVTLCAVIG